MRSLGRWLLVIALSLSIGLQWTVVQGAAWLGMIAAYSKEVTISRSLSMTFSGQHPCKLCKVVQQGESTREKQTAEGPCIKLVLAAPQAEPYIFPALVSSCEAESVPAVVRESHPPPLPPPEAV